MQHVILEIDKLIKNAPDFTGTTEQNENLIKALKRLKAYSLMTPSEKRASDIVEQSFLKVPTE